MPHTKLFKIFDKKYCFFFISICLILYSCINNQESKKEPCFLIGNWQIVNIETNDSKKLDSLSLKIYRENLTSFIKGAKLIIADSTYKCTIGDELDAGLWKYDPIDSILSFKSHNKRIQLFKVGFQNSLLKLEPKNSLSGEYWLLKK